MDRLIHTALNSLANLRDTRVTSAQNLANLAVPGFRRDLQNEGSAHFLNVLNTQSARAFQLERADNGFSRQAGPMDRTGDLMDLAIADRGFFYILPPEGSANQCCWCPDERRGRGDVEQRIATDHPAAFPRHGGGRSGANFDHPD